jgi:hypothetical protein
MGFAREGTHVLMVIEVALVAKGPTKVGIAIFLANVDASTGSIKATGGRAAVRSREEIRIAVGPPGVEQQDGLNVRSGS